MVMALPSVLPIGWSRIKESSISNITRYSGRMPTSRKPPSCFRVLLVGLLSIFCIGFGKSVEVAGKEAFTMGTGAGLLSPLRVPHGY